MNNINSITINQFPESLKTLIVNFSGKISCQDEVEVDETLELVADKISTLYAQCLTKEWHDSKGEMDLRFYTDPTPEKFPSNDLVIVFREVLKEKMLKKLKEQDEYGPYSQVDLSTDYVPEKLLNKILDESGLSNEISNFCGFFPVKTALYIEHWFEKKEIVIL